MRAPFFTTPPEVVARMLEIADTGAADFVVDLGSGDGRIVIRAALAHGARGLGVDLDPALVARARDNAARAGVADRVRFEVRDVLRTDVSQASVVTVYLVPFLMERLEARLLAGLRPGARIVSHAFALKNWPFDRTETVRLSGRHEAQGDSSRVFLYIVPAQARGAWRAPGGWQLRVQQNFQMIDVEAALDGRPRAVATAQLQGVDIGFAGEGFAFRGRVSGDRIEGEMLERGARRPLAFERAP